MINHSLRTYKCSFSYFLLLHTVSMLQEKISCHRHFKKVAKVSSPVYDQLQFCGT